MSNDIELQSVDQDDKLEFLKSIFDHYDRNNDGVLELNELKRLLTHEKDTKLPKDVVKRILKISDPDGNGVIDFDEFCEMWENPQLKSYFQPYLSSYVRLIIPKSQKSDYKLAGVVTDGTGQYEDQYSCCPPSLGMLTITIIICALFIADEILESGSTTTGRGPIAKNLIFNPYTKEEAWRYLSYMFVHIGHMHLVVNCCIQLLLGVPLEMVHGWWRVLLTYLAGVLAGSLLSAITDPNTKMAGASGGVYALITAQIANIVMNWAEMTLPLVQLLIYLIITFLDIGTSIYNRYWLEVDNQVAYMAHIAGAMAGLLVGIQILRNINLTQKERYIWWFCLIAYILLTGICVILNFCDVTMFEKK